MLTIKEIEDQIRVADNQPEVHATVDKYFVVSYPDDYGKDGWCLCTEHPVEQRMAEMNDTDFKIGVDDNLASDGKAHDFGSGKWSIPGDNIPTTLEDAKRMAIDAIESLKEDRADDLRKWRESL